MKNKIYTSIVEASSRAKRKGLRVVRKFKPQKELQAQKIWNTQQMEQ